MKKKMTEEELLLEVSNAIGSVFRVNGLQVQAETTLIADLGAESIDFLDLSCELEKIVDAEIDFRKLFEAKRNSGQGDALDLTVQEVVNLLKMELDSSTSDGPVPPQEISALEA